MTDQPGQWRPALPKPSPAIDIPRTSSAGPHTRPSAAIRGATQAFLSRPAPEIVKTNTGSTNGARAAAAGARNIVRPATAPRPDHGNNTDTSLLRGRQLGVQSPPTVPSKPQRLLPTKSASTIAAQFASSSPSPVRSGSQGPSRRVSPNPNCKSKSPPKNTVRGIPDGLPISAPRPIRPIPLTSNNRPLLDLDHALVPLRNVSSNSSQASPAKTSPSALAQAAARYVTPAASPFELPEKSVSIGGREPATRTSSSSAILDSELSSPLELVESKSTTADDNRKPTQSLNQSASAGSIGSKSAPIPIRNVAPRKVIPKASLGSSHVKDYRTGMTETALADAIVASSLASSRASSPTRRDRPLPPPRSRSHSLLHRHHHGPLPEAIPRAAPMKPMKQTLRNTKPDEDEDDVGIIKRGRRHFVRKHPNKHHEGDRKRWSDKITERERKRYEGVWAANRGLYSFWESADTEFGQTAKPTGHDDMVVNVVVRDIWERSRLPKDVLEEIWDLVAPEDAKALGRWEFVVGLWLIDQRLKGRKLPTRVSQSVWASVRNTLGISVSSKPYEK
jgi:hypothetical protein